MADVVGEAVQVARVAGELKVDAGHACAEGDDAEGAWGEMAERRRKTKRDRRQVYAHA